MNYSPDMFDGLPPRPLEERPARPPTPWSVWIILAAALLGLAMCCLWALGVGR